MRDKQHSFPLRINSRLSMWRTTRLKMCWAGGWCLNRVLSYLCFSVEQGKGNSSEEGVADLSNSVSFFLDSAGNGFIFFLSPYIYNTSVFLRQSFSSDSMGSDSGITSRGWCIHLSLPYFEDLRLVQIGTYGGLCTASHISLTT